jgi:hypothetical protein
VWEPIPEGRRAETINEILCLSLEYWSGEVNQDIDLFDYVDPARNRQRSRMAPRMAGPASNLVLAHPKLDADELEEARKALIER